MKKRAEEFLKSRPIQLIDEIPEFMKQQKMLVEFAHDAAHFIINSHNGNLADSPATPVQHTNTAIAVSKKQAIEKQQLKLYRKELDYPNAKVTGFCFANSLKEAESFFHLKNGDKNPDTKIEEIEIKKGCFCSFTHSVKNHI